MRSLRVPIPWRSDYEGSECLVGITSVEVTRIEIGRCRLNEATSGDWHYPVRQWIEGGHQLELRRPPAASA